ncbi:hypothetical protein [Polaribacter sp. SA4-12]|uniref:hypothetical protein n=1 Tax=Polaribacter sp. SA4-12 TaxID=1312072 RepID=UPI000B3C085E|nr:hypothetical protein [Polaribacter sp. SA4-12]ARV16625.1 hypothetical protein BTO07_16430 [Polaribacter sp. SA4-12]
MGKRNIQSQWNGLIDKLDLQQVNILGQSIERSLKLAIVDAEKENQNAIEIIKKENDLNQLYKLIIERKANFLKSKTSDYSILHKSYGSLLRRMDVGDSEKTAKVMLLFFTIFKKDIFFEFEDFNKEIIEEVYNYKKNEILYLLCVNIIDYFNNDINNTIKLPSIENFEIDTFLLLETLRKEQEASSKEVLDKQTEINEIRDKYHKKINQEGREKIKNLSNELFELNSDYIKSKEELKDSLFDIKLLKKEKDYLFNYNIKREPLYVIQFDNTVWGDNFPALKVFYKFLFDYYYIDFNWSFFTYTMTTESKDVINLNIKIINKGETGYLLFILKEFFVSSISNDYFKWLSKKITIEGQNINKSFYDGKIWDSSQNFPNQEKINIINELHKNIENIYNKV